MLARIWHGALKAAPLRIWVLIGGAPVISAFAVWLVTIVWRGGWTPDRQEQQLDFLGTSLIVTLCLLGVIVVTLAAVKVRGTGPGGSSIEVDTNGSGDVRVQTSDADVKVSA